MSQRSLTVPENGRFCRKRKINSSMGSNRSSNDTNDHESAFLLPGPNYLDQFLLVPSSPLQPLLLFSLAVLSSSRSTLPRRFIFPIILTRPSRYKLFRIFSGNGHTKVCARLFCSERARKLRIPERSCI